MLTVAQPTGSTFIDLIQVVQQQIPLLKGLPGFPVALAASLSVAVVVGPLAAPRLHQTRGRLTIWLVALLVPTTATWTVPQGESNTREVLHGCSVGTLPTLEMPLTSTPAEVTANMLLLVPAGMAAMLWTAGIRRLVALLTALSVSPLIETVQLIPQTHRTCQFGDVVNNSLGVLLGFSLAAGASLLLDSVRRITRTNESAPPVGSQLE